MRTSLRLRLNKEQRIGVFSFIVLIILMEILLHQEHLLVPRPNLGPISNELLLIQEQIKLDSPKQNYEKPIFVKAKIKLQNFNPNKLNQKQWEELGFSQRQAEVILNYKEIVGGTFHSKTQIKKCFVINDEKYDELKTFILLPETSSFDEKKEYQKFEKPKIKYHNFNPNAFTQEQWQNFGFSEKQAAGIIKYRNYLGGNFTTLDQIKACYMINEEKYKELLPFIKITEIAENKIEKNYPKYEKTETENPVNTNNPSEQKTNNNKPKVNLKPFNPNDLDEKGWIELGFSEKQVRTILNWKRVLGGKFSSLEQIQKCYAISKDKFEELRPFIKLE